MLLNKLLASHEEMIYWQEIAISTLMLNLPPYTQRKLSLLFYYPHFSLDLANWVSFWALEVNIFDEILQTFPTCLSDPMSETASLRIVHCSSDTLETVFKN